MLSKDKTRFVLYVSFYDALQDLPLDRKGMLLDLIFNYEIHGDTDAFEAQFTDMPNDVKMAFRFIKGQLDKDQEKWREVCSKRAAAGRKSANVRWGDQNKANATVAEQNITKITNVKSVKTKITKITDNEYDNEYDNDVVVDNNAHVRATTSTPTIKQIESYRKALANKFYIKGEDDAFCRAVLQQTREFPQDCVRNMANGVPRTITMDGKAVWQWSERVDIAAGYRVWIERIVAAWDAGKYRGMAA